MSGSSTERLYYTDAYLSDFTARVVDRADDGRRIYLDRTAFYPTSGGQPYDTGIIASANVTDVVDEGDRIAHLVDAPVADDEVRGKIHWSRRFDNMQQHTGQHLLSAVFEDLFGAKTVSVHFGDASSTLDLGTDTLSAASLEEAEERANLIVAENRAVTVAFEDAATAKGLRKAVDREGALRIITIADVDRSACGGTHVNTTGEIGSILLRGTERVRKSTRVEFVCGLRGVRRARTDYQALKAIATSLSTSVDSAAPLVAAQAAQLKEAEKERRSLELIMAAQRAQSLYDQQTPSSDGVRVIPLIAGPSVSSEILRAIAINVMEKPKAAFVGSSTEGHVLVSTSEDSGLDAGKALREALTALGGKGGGSPRLAQGAAPDGKTQEALHLILAALTRGR